jgi:RNA polymerase sigma factor (sigma-70 family)
VHRSSPIDPRDDPRDDRQLLAVLSTDPGAFESFYRRHVDRVTGFAVRRCDRPEEVADLVSAVFLGVIESSPRYQPERGDPTAWLFGIATNQLRMQRRRAWRSQATVARISGQRLLAPADQLRLEEGIDAARLAGAARRAIDRLPRGERAAFSLVARDGLSAKQAGDVLGLTETAVRVRVSRARRKLRLALGDETTTGDGPLPGWPPPRRRAVFSDHATTPNLGFEEVRP